MCSMHSAPHQPRAKLHLLSRTVMDPEWIQTKTETTNFFFSRKLNGWRGFGRLSPSLSPSSPTFVPVDDDRRGPKWAHSDLDSPTNNPQTALSTPWIYFPRPFPVRSLSTSVHGYPRMPTVLSSTRHDRHRSIILHPHVKFHLPLPCRIGATLDGGQLQFRQL